MVHHHDDHDEEESEEDEAEVMPLPPTNQARQRNSVSAEAFGTWNQRVSFVAPVYPKGLEEQIELNQIMSCSFLFNSLDAKDMQVLIMAMRGPMPIEPGTRIIQEGDSGNHLYIITDGMMDCTKVLGGVETVVKTCVKGDLFGELALLYNCPRAASVTARTASILWEMDRETFNNIVLEAVQRKRTQCCGILRRFHPFASMSQHELDLIIDALKEERHPQGTIIIQQGDVGTHFYIIREGQVVAQKITPESPEPVVMLMEEGDYFGELALLSGNPRAATVYAHSPEVKLLSMDAATFRRLMGPAEDYLHRQVARYG